MLWPTQNGREQDIHWKYTEHDIDAVSCVDMADIGPGKRFNGISSFRQYEHPWKSRYYCEYYL